MNRRVFWKKVQIVILLLVSSLTPIFSVEAGEVIWSSYLKGTSIANSAEIRMSDFILRPAYNKTEYDYKVSFVYGRENRKDIQGSAVLNYEVEYSVLFYNGDMALQYQSTGNKLKITYDPVNPGATVLEAHRIFNTPSVDFEKVKLVITNIDPIGATMPDDVRLELSLINKSSFDFTGTAPEIGFQSSDNRLYWSYMKGADYYHVEWVYIDTEDGYTPANTAAAFDYKEPVRVVVKEQYFDKFNFTYPSGNVYFRIRGVGIYGGVETTSEKLSSWYYVANPYTIGSSFESGKNWQYVTTYAEDGKSKKIITYYDGSLRGRQVLTNLSSDNTTIAGETKYDYEGRPVINILPAPLSQTELGYVNNLNTFANGKASYDKTMSTNEAEALSNTSKAYIYYSGLNPEINSASNQYIPDAEGYPYSQVLYMRDGTGKPKMQSGVGKPFHLGDPSLANKSTLYKYSTANATELHRMFGSNVGNASHYKKNYTIDPNGQISVSYFDQEERVVATCLTGNAPSNLDALTTNTTIPIKVNLDASNTIDKTNKISKSVSSINNVLENLNYTFTYSLKGVINQSQLLPGFCKECVYDLVFTIKDPDDLVAYTQTVAGIQPSTVSCSTNVHDAGTLINTTVNFAKTGVYQVIKELRLSSDALTISLAEIKTKSGYPSYTTFEQSFLANVDISKCDISCEDNCRTEVLRQNSAWKANPALYESQINSAVTNCMNTYCPAYLAGIVDKTTQNECKSIYDQIIEQVRPGGVFNPANNPSCSVNNWICDARDNIINYSGGFKDANGNAFFPQPTVVQLQTAAGFDDNWLDELAKEHREYKHYENCQLLIPSKNYDKNMAIINDWTEAVNKGYVGSGINPVTTDPLFTAAANPGYTPAASARTSILARINNYTTETALQIDVDNSGSITNRVVSLEEFVSSYIPYGTNTLYTPDLATKWKTYRSFYNGFKLEEERKLTGGSTPNYGFGAGTKYKNIGYFSDVNTIVTNPSLPNTMAAIDLLNDQNMLQGCADVCPENAIVWLSMIENEYGKLSVSNYNNIYTNFLNYCNGSCGYKNPLGLLLIDDLSNTYLQAVQTTLSSISAGYSLASIAMVNPYIPITDCENGVNLQAWNMINHWPPGPVPELFVFPSAVPDYNGSVPNIDYEYYVWIDRQVYNFLPSPIAIENFMTKFSTYLEITTSGTYYFKLNTDNVARIYIDGVLYDFSPFTPFAIQKKEYNVSINLTSGFHHVYIEYIQGSSQYQVLLQWSQDGVSYSKIPNNRLYKQLPKYGDNCTIAGFYECPLIYNNHDNCGEDATTYVSSCAEKILQSIEYIVPALSTTYVSCPNRTTNPMKENVPEFLDNSPVCSSLSQILISGSRFCTGNGSDKLVLVRANNSFKVYASNNSQFLDEKCICNPGLENQSPASFIQEIKFYTMDQFGAKTYLNANDIIKVSNPEADCALLASLENVYSSRSSYGIKVKVLVNSSNVLSELVAYVEVDNFSSPENSVTWKVPGLPANTLCNNSITIDWVAVKNTCIENLNNTAKYEAYVAWKAAETEFISKYLNEQVNKCFDAPFEEHLSYSYTNNEYHYTLYYYDQAGNLVQTVPPAGVDLLSSSAFDETTGAYLTGNEPAHRLLTKYKYNSLQQLMWTITPDGGESYFWYDSKGELRLSQNDKQLAASSSSANQYSYTRYDRQGRIEEVGQIQDLPIQTRAYMTNITNEKDILALLDNRVFPVVTDATTLTQRTVTVYDEGDGQQQNLRGRVASFSSKPTETATEVTTLYSYDPHGNVKNLRQDISGFAVKQIDYDYDLISGKVNKVYYQKGQPDQFVHQYEYDSDNRVKAVYTSPDDVVWEEDARYFYYKHGPLARLELGQDKVQGLDYYYTIQGWPKGVNIPALRTPDAINKPRVTADIGLDGMSSINNLHKYIGQDEYSYALGYFNGDYVPIQTGLNLYAASNDQWTSMSTNIKASGLYNGNIATMITQIHSMGSKVNIGGSFLAKEQSGLHAYAYRYDQLNRLTTAAHYKTYNSGWEARSTPQAMAQAFDARYAYDPNGNITDALINGQSTGLMDNLSYKYNTSGGNLINNRLNYVVDAAGQTEGTDLPSGQLTGNYQYDAIGNLMADASEGITDITWSVYGKVLTVLNSSNSKADLIFTYDAAGNRVKKYSNVPSGGTKTTYYVRDASGKIMATYETGEVTTTSYPVYGSTRLGSWVASSITNEVQRRIPYNKQYELSNHLGNVLATVPGIKLGVDLNSDNVAEYYTSIALTGQDYYPFGMIMPVRSFGVGDYRFGFNGKEKDNEWNSGGATYDYGFRIYDPRIGKFLSVDPLTQNYPWYTPYQFAGNNPIQYIDLDGLEELDPKEVISYEVGKIDQALKNANENLVQVYDKVISAMGKIANDGLQGNFRLPFGLQLYGSGTTEENKKDLPADNAVVYPMDVGYIEFYAKVASMHKVVGKLDKSTSGDGRLTRSNADGGKLKLEKLQTATLTTKEGVGKYVKSEPKLMEVTKGFLEKVVGYDTYKMAKDVNVQTNVPEYSYNQYTSAPNQDNPDTTYVIRTNNSTGVKDTVDVKITK